MSEDTGIDRRRLVRILIVLAIGIPILIEAVTFLGLVSHSFGDDGADDETPTPTADLVGVGDDMIAATESPERITTASVGRTESGWRFVLTVLVENEMDVPYELRLGAVETTQGTTVDASATTGRIDPGDSTTVTGSWLLPEGERPRTVTVTRVTYGADGPSTTVETVALKPVPVSSS